MNHSMTTVTTMTTAERRPDAPGARGQHTPLSAIDPLGTAAMRSAGRVADPAARPARPVTFNSAL